MSIHPVSAPAARGRGFPDPTIDLTVFAGTETQVSIQSAFEVQAERTPLAAAVCSVHGVCSFGELERISRTIASVLVARGVAQGDTVAIYADRNPALVFCLLGVLRAGAAFQIIDAAYPLPRILACVTQTSPAFLLVAGDVPLPEPLPAALGLSGLERLARIPAQVEAVWSALSVLLPEGGVAPVSTSRVDPDAVAYVNFTSGSTGTPKGIVTGHAPLPHFVTWHVAHGALSAADHFSMLSGLSHDPLLRDVFTPLSIGASLHIPQQGTIFDADALFEWFSAEQISVAHMTPSFGEILIAGAAGRGRLTHLRRVYWGGEVLRRRLVRAVQELAPNVLQTNFYGATETPQAMAYFDLDERARAAADEIAIPIGHGIEGAQLLVMNDQHQLCARGETGEIWIRSPYLSKGYLNDAGATSARFVANPFGRAEDDRCYRTGDLGRYGDEGEVLFAGRLDHQLKLRGFRIEPAEIVAALERVAGVRRALVLAKQLHGDQEGDKHLIAYVVRDAGAAHQVSEPALRQQLQAELPSYMVPRYFVLLSALPLLANGKVDLQALPVPHDQPAAQGSGARLPRNDAERQMVAIWAELLGVETVAVDQSFLELGGDSLSAIRALSRMRRLGIPEDVARGIFQGRTIAELCDTSAAESLGSGARPRPLTGHTKTTLLINVLRGFLVLTLIADHWREGLFKRFPQIPAGFLRAVEPVFDIPTPGFAFVFGVGLAYSQYDNFLRNPDASRRMLRGGATVLALGTLFMGLSRNLGVVARGLPLDYDLFCTNFFLPTLYYWLALASAPLWFSLLSKRENKPGGALVMALVLVVVCRLLNELFRFVLLPHEQTGLLQLGRLMLTARFSYFNLSTGALLGVFFGLYLRRERSRPNLVSLLSTGGAILLALGIAVHLLQRDMHPDGMTSPNIMLPKWLVYVGATLLLGSLFELLLLASARVPLRGALEWLGVVGQCAMPIFILQGVALDVSAFGRALGLPDRAATAVAVLSFLVTIGWMMRRIHGLYYGAIASDAPLQGELQT